MNTLKTLLKIVARIVIFPIALPFFLLLAIVLTLGGKGTWKNWNWTRDPVEE